MDFENKLYKRQYMPNLEKPVSLGLSKPHRRLLPINNKQNSNNILRKLVRMDGPASSQERKPPRSLKHIQNQSNSEGATIINVNAQQDKNKTEVCNPSTKVEEPDISRTGSEYALEIPFRQAVELQIQNDVQDYLHDARKRNKKKRMLHKKVGRRFSSPDDFTSFKNL